MRYFLYSSILAALLFQGCSKNREILKPENIKEIEQNKRLDRLKGIKISEKSNRKSFQVFLDENNRVNYLCYNGYKNCNYYDIRKHSFKMTKDVKEDVVWMYKNSFSPDFSKSVEGVQCGRGSMTGWLVALPFIELKNHNDSNLKLCYNRFTKIDSLQIGTRLVTGALTFGTSLATAGNMHTRKFDEEEFREAVVDSNLDMYQKEIFKLPTTHKLHSGFDVIYLDVDDMRESLEEAYERIKSSKANRDGLIFIDESSKEIITTIIFSKYKSKDIIKNISNQISDIFTRVDKNGKKLMVSEDDILKYIPKEVEKPKLPKLLAIQKDEFETKKEFEDRVIKSVEQRQEQIKNIQKEYDLDVFTRNEYISSLEESYKNYIISKKEKNSETKEALEENLDILAKILFVQNINGFDAKEFSYDAERQKLYFTIFSNKRYFNQRVVATVEAEYAKAIKLEKSYEIEPNIEFSKNMITLKGFNIIEPKSEKSFDVKYTNINYTPTKLKVTMKSEEGIRDNIDLKEFEAYKQKRGKIVDNQKEIWYIDVVNRINAKVPTWFSNPPQTEDIISYGDGDSLAEAKSNALKELAFMIKVRVKSSFEVSKEQSGSFRTYKEVKRDISTSTDVELSSKDFSIYKQERYDSKWYVALIYKGDKR